MMIVFAILFVIQIPNFSFYIGTGFFTMSPDILLTQLSIGHVGDPQPACNSGSISEGINL